MFSFVCGAMTLLSMYLIGKKNWWGWVISALSQFLYFKLNWDNHLYGILPVTIACFIIAVKAAYNWDRTPQ